MDWEDFFRAVERWEKGEQLDEREARIIAYGWTAGTCGQRLRPNDAVRVKVARRQNDRDYGAEAKNYALLHRKEIA
jgi:hypothetical protein